MYNLLENIHFWISLSFIIAIVIIYYKGKNKITGFINTKIDEIRNELQESEDILTEALSILNSKKEELEKSNQKHKDIKNKRMSNYDSMFEKALDNLNSQAKIYKLSFDNYIINEEKKHLQIQKQELIDKSIAIVQEYTNNLTPEDHDELISKSLERIKNTN